MSKRLFFVLLCGVLVGSVAAEQETIQAPRAVEQAPTVCIQAKIAEIQRFDQPQKIKAARKAKREKLKAARELIALYHSFGVHMNEAIDRKCAQIESKDDKKVIVESLRSEAIDTLNHLHNNIFNEPSGFSAIFSLIEKSSIIQKMSRRISRDTIPFFHNGTVYCNIDPYGKGFCSKSASSIPNNYENNENFFNSLKRFYRTFYLGALAVLSELFEKPLCDSYVVNGEVFKFIPTKNGNLIAKHPTYVRRIPIVFHPSYDISFFGIEKLYSFDSCKYGKVYECLADQFDFGRWGRFYKPEMVSDKQLPRVHTKDYLQSLKSSATIARIAELPPLAWMPNFLLQRSILNPMKWATGGSLLAGRLALAYGWSINLSGGYHHAKADQGGGFCAYADIPLMAYDLLDSYPKARVLIVDLDAHQGNGHEAICAQDKRIAIFDMYNCDVYPRDEQAKKAITFDFPCPSGTSDQEYLDTLKRELPQAIKRFKPSFIIYNAGTDILQGDRLGQLAISEQGIMQRDEFVFGLARNRQIPIAMLLSGGYTQQSVQVICKSLKNVVNNFLYS